MTRQVWHKLTLDFGMYIVPVSYSIKGRNNAFVCTGTVDCNTWREFYQRPTVPVPVLQVDGMFPKWRICHSCSTILVRRRQSGTRWHPKRKRQSRSWHDMHRLQQQMLRIRVAADVDPEFLPIRCCSSLVLQHLLIADDTRLSWATCICHIRFFTSTSATGTVRYDSV